MDKLGTLLPRVLARQPVRGRIAELRVRIVFEEIVGPELAAGCEQVNLQRGTLLITTSNPALAHQLRLDGERLLERINLARPGRRVTAMRVRTGRPAGSRA